MHKPTHLLILCFFTTVSFAQKTDSIKIFYNSDEYKLTRDQYQQLETFFTKGWDKIAIRSFTDEVDDTEYNFELSRKRASEVSTYFLSRNYPAGAMSLQYFGETIPLGDNSTEEGRAINRRTVITGIQYPRIPPRPVTDPSKPVTITLDNGFILTYKPSSFPDWLLESFRKGEGIQIITNTTEMRNGNFYNNTTAGEILSSVLIVDWGTQYPCKLDSPVYVKIPVTISSKCAINKVKFFKAVENFGLRIWQEKEVDLTPEIINGRPYIGMWVSELCGAFNFDFKIDNGCFEIDSAHLWVNANIKGLNSELIGLNTVYVPRKLPDSSYSILLSRNQFTYANISFRLFNGKRIIRSFTNQPITSFPFDPVQKGFLLTTDTIHFESKGLKDFTMLFKVNRDRYRVLPEKNKYEFIYLNRDNEKLTADLFATGKRKRAIEYRNVDISLIPVDPVTGYRIIDKQLFKKLNEMKAAAEKKATAGL